MAARPSDFYLACCNGELETVKNRIQALSVREINRLETDGNTALHAASFHGHTEIVKLLLEYKANRNILNENSLTPCDAAKTREMKHLLKSFPESGTIGNGNNRFGQEEAAIEWLAVDENVIKRAAAYRQRIRDLAENLPFSIEPIIQDYLESQPELRDDGCLDEIIALFRQAARENDPTYIVKAYTAETPFYRSLNKELARTSQQVMNVAIYSLDPQFQRFWKTHGRIAGIISQHEKMKPCRFQGSCYRGMRISETELAKYQQGARVMNRSFLSATVEENIALRFAVDLEEDTDKLPVICKYKIRNRHTALDIAEMSCYPNEREILIAPYTVFTVVTITSRALGPTTYKVMRWN